MPVEITVGPPVLVINQGSTFLVTDLGGEIAADSEQGLFANDTRFMSYYAIYANGERWVRLTSSPITYYSARVHAMSPAFSTEDGDIPAGKLGLVISRAVGAGVHEDLDLTNHGQGAVRFNLEIVIRADFADLFEVKSHKFIRRGRIDTDWDLQRNELRIRYVNRDFRRALIIRQVHSTSPPHHANGRITFEIALAPGETWHSCCHYTLVFDEKVLEPLRGCSDSSHPLTFDELQRDWQERATKLTSGPM